MSENENEHESENLEKQVKGHESSEHGCGSSGGNGFFGSRNSGVLILVALSLLLSSANLFYSMGTGNVLQVQSQQIAQVSGAVANLKVGGASGSAVNAASSSASANAAQGASGDAGIAKLAAEILPSGIPPVYGSELGVDFGAVQDSMNKLRVFDNSIILEGDILQRYIAVATKISCEYCCGAKAIAFDDGRAACSCAHSAAMRGLAKYLLKNHASEYTNDQILAELAKWKASFFPKQTLQKEISLRESKGTAGSAKATGSAGSLSSLPNMVGGC